ncbi:uncharacterized protein LOC116211606 [Punica granatum]|uniref:VQ domain-containing protein n=2 Tax=Punica granatum TaxID=22663 RepID=A0A218X0M2_PUNGR|nr:uncharacterized protein LOC116211606 [Punica granatum]OWM78463.1 hypothetical protein CDL15_Pgr016187 [Punica granatum]PKI68710.1 hypothetical protein CRG98_010767 [Punica granatum]
MDMLGVADHKMKSSKREGKRRSSSGKNGIKVVYISSPMKVKTSASEFRAIVQELTGRDSDVARFMDGSSNEDDGQNRTEDHSSSHLNIKREEKDHLLSGVAYFGSDNMFSEDYNTYYFENDSPTTSESLVEQYDGNLFSMPHVERSFRENNFPFVFQESVLLDVFN